MKIKTEDLTGPALDWAVAKCLGATKIQPYKYNGRDFLRIYLDGGVHAPWEPSRYWNQGGPLIERGEVCLSWMNNFGAWHAQIGDEAEFNAYGPTPLIAAMRCVVAANLGDEVDVPDELV